MALEFTQFHTNAKMKIIIVFFFDIAKVTTSSRTECFAKGEYFFSRDMVILTKKKKKRGKVNYLQGLN